MAKWTGNIRKDPATGAVIARVERDETGRWWFILGDRRYRSTSVRNARACADIALAKRDDNQKVTLRLEG